MFAPHLARDSNQRAEDTVKELMIFSRKKVISTKNSHTECRHCKSAKGNSKFVSVQDIWAGETKSRGVIFHYFLSDIFPWCESIRYSIANNVNHRQCDVVSRFHDIMDYPPLFHTCLPCNEDLDSFSRDLVSTVLCSLLATSEIFHS